MSPSKVRYRPQDVRIGGQYLTAGSARVVWVRELRRSDVPGFGVVWTVLVDGSAVPVRLDDLRPVVRPVHVTNAGEWYDQANVASCGGSNNLPNSPK